ncbi:head GIN domain-containing protein [Flavobacterium selenitireducens]|uniref:head GIN domain-containing protein n=1 Tax=Flavobacterium selenitireducens TaxID=2722704 RepID=UPI00168B0D22|nr:head GIN domain-containing protein [Flavobacterium selenitireducens]MBD3580884.1 DUF2807 domain-containing protein [Flavobacterium selenitireducens]
MKTILATIAALLIVSASVAGPSLKVRKVKTGTYDRIMVSGDFTVKLVEGTEGAIFIEGDRIDVNHLNVLTEGNILRIYPKKNFRDWCGDMKNLTVVVPVENLEEIILAGTGKIVSEVALKANRFKTQLSGSGEIAIEVQTNETEVFLSGSGKIKLSGSTGRLYSNINGDGDLQAYALQSATTQATIIGSGVCEVNSTETLNAQIAGSGRISYTGNPKIEQQTIIGTGLIAARQ